MSDRTDSQPARLITLITEMMAAGSTLAELVGIEWTAVPLEERRQAVEDWQRAVMHIAMYDTEHSNQEGTP